MNQIMKRFLRTWIIPLFLIVSYGLASGETIGHVSFFFVSQVQTDEDFEVKDDFQYYYKQITPWLIKNGFSFSYHSNAPISRNIEEDQSITIQKDQLKQELGIILFKKDGPYKILYGVHTDVDILMEIRDFFDIMAVTSPDRNVMKDGL
jgi:hypothetical protein